MGDYCKMRQLLILSCSARKNKTNKEPIPAIERYDGVFFRVLQKAMREGYAPPDLEVIILSARFGLIFSQTPIPFYDQRLTLEQINNLRPEIVKKLGDYLKEMPDSEILVNLGKTYQPLVQSVTGLEKATWVSGGSGQRAQALKSWLKRNQKKRSI